MPHGTRNGHVLMGGCTCELNEEVGTFRNQRQNSDHCEDCQNSAILQGQINYEPVDIPFAELEAESCVLC